jgi:hypothetical protein
MKDFYLDKIGFNSYQKKKKAMFFIKTGKSMLLIYILENTSIKGNSKFPASWSNKSTSCIHFSLEIERNYYGNSKNRLIHNGFDIAKRWSGTTEVVQFYFRNPVGNHVELITEGKWSVGD